MYLGNIILCILVVLKTFIFYTHWFSHCYDSAYRHPQLYRTTVTSYSSAHHHHQLHRTTATRYSSAYHHQLYRTTAARYSSAYYQPANLRSHPASLGFTQSVS
jgi:hypothetical protein